MGVTMTERRTLVLLAILAVFLVLIWLTYWGSLRGTERARVVSRDHAEAEAPLIPGASLPEGHGGRTEAVASPTGEEVGDWIEGVVLSEGLPYSAPDGSPVFVLVEAQALWDAEAAKAQIRHSNVGSASLGMIKADSSGRFAFRLAEGVESVELGALGAGVVSDSDVTAIPGTECEVPLAHLYATDVVVLDKVTGSRVFDTRSCRPMGGGTGFSRPSGGKMGIRSRLARSFLTGDEAAQPTIRYFAVSETDLADGPEVTLSFNEPGYMPAKIKLIVPPLIESIPVQEVYLERSDAPVSSLTVKVSRDGEWEAVKDYEYYPLGRLYLFVPGEELPSYKVDLFSLKPGEQKVERIPIERPLCVLNIGGQALKAGANSADTGIELALEGAGFDALYSELDLGHLVAVAAPPRARSGDSEPWLGVRQFGSTQLTARRYSAAKGLIIDGLLPGRYELFWGENHEDYRMKVSANLPVADVELDSGLYLAPIQ